MNHVNLSGLNFLKFNIDLITLNGFSNLIENRKKYISILKNIRYISISFSLITLVSVLAKLIFLPLEDLNMYANVLFLLYVQITLSLVNIYLLFNGKNTDAYLNSLKQNIDECHRIFNAKRLSTIFRRWYNKARLISFSWCFLEIFAGLHWALSPLIFYIWKNNLITPSLSGKYFR